MCAYTDAYTRGYAEADTYAQAAPLELKPFFLPNGHPNVPYSATLSATGGIPPYKWSIIAGSLNRIDSKCEVRNYFWYPKREGTVPANSALASSMQNHYQPRQR